MMNHTQRQFGSKNSAGERQLVIGSMRAQDFIVKKEMARVKQMNQTIDIDDIGLDVPHNYGSTPQNAVSQMNKTMIINYPQSTRNKQRHKSIFTNNFASSTPTTETGTIDTKTVGATTWALPVIAARQSIDQDKFGKGFIDISIVNKKMRQSMRIESQATRRCQSQVEKTVQNESIDRSIDDFNPVEDENKESAYQGQMSAKVLETWINETLKDAEHLDLPGCIVKSEVLIPINRYQIDRKRLVECGLPNSMIDRIYRALFVYSVGFYQLIKDQLKHTKKNYKVITDLWKVFQILLEYCCRNDYKTLIQEITIQHNKEFQEMKENYQKKSDQQAENERNLKKNMELLQKQYETVDQERANERLLRLKMEEEFAQNNKTHEEEVQLRLEFEGKLNNLTRDKRLLETQLKRMDKLNKEYKAKLEDQEKQLNVMRNENKVVKNENVQQNSRITANLEKINGLLAQIDIKRKQMSEQETRVLKYQEDSDISKHKLQMVTQENQEIRVKSDILTSQNDRLASEINHNQNELKEMRELTSNFKEKNSNLWDELQKVTNEYQDYKREMLRYDENLKKKEDKISNLNGQLKETQDGSENLQSRFNTLMIQLEKVTDQHEGDKKALKETTDKLHITNKVRHEFEILAGEKEEDIKAFKEQLKYRDKQLKEHRLEIDDLELERTTLQREKDTLAVKVKALEQKFEVTKKNLNEKVQSINDLLQAERDNTEVWQDRFDEESKEHRKTTALLMQLKQDHRDATIQDERSRREYRAKDREAEMWEQKYQTCLTEVNNLMAKNTALERELNNLRTKFNMYKQSQEVLVENIKRELETVESRFQLLLHRNAMVGEDFRAQSQFNMEKYLKLKESVKQFQEEYHTFKAQIETQKELTAIVELELEQCAMEKEDYFGMLQRNDEKFRTLNSELQILRLRDEKFEDTLQAEKQKLTEVEEEKYKLQTGLEYVEFQLIQKDKKIEELIEIAKEKVSPEKLKEMNTVQINKTVQTDLDLGYVKMLEQSHQSLHQASSTQMNSALNMHGQSPPIELDQSRLILNQSFAEDQSPASKDNIIHEEQESDLNIPSESAQESKSRSQSQAAVDLSIAESLKTLLGQKDKMISEEELTSQRLQSQALNEQQKKQKKKPTSIKGLLKVGFTNPK